MPVSHYPTPGLTVFAPPPVAARARGIYRATTGDLFVVAGATLYFVGSDGTVTALGALADKATPVSMSDNGLVLVIVDGSSTGYVVDLTVTAAAKPFGPIRDPHFLGADRVDYLDTYFVFNNPGTTQFFISLSLPDFAMMTSAAASSTTAGMAFDSLDIAGKTGSADQLVTIIAVHDTLWLIGALTTEIWYNSGAADFTFERSSGAFVEHGCVARYSVAKQDISAFWLSQDREGHCIVVRGTGYEAVRISTHSIEATFQAYAATSRVDDAIGYCYQQQGHAFYVITFPSADATWAYELQTGQWHELAWTDVNGTLRRHRAAGCAFAYDQNLVVDWQNGTVYQLDPANMTDAGNPIVRIRTFPHMISDGRRVSYKSFIVDMQTGNMPASQNDVPVLEDFSADFAFDFGPILDPGRNQISLRWSDTRGATWSNPISQDVGGSGDYQKSILFQRLGMGRDRVFEISWLCPLPTALNGAFVEMQAHGS